MYTREDGGDGLPPISQRRGIRRATKQLQYGENRYTVVLFVYIKELYSEYKG